MEAPPRHNDANGLREGLTERLGFGRTRPNFVLALFAHGMELAKGVSHRSQIPTPSEAGWIG